MTEVKVHSTLTVIEKVESVSDVAGSVAVTV